MQNIHSIFQLKVVENWAARFHYVDTHKHTDEANKSIFKKSGVAFTQLPFTWHYGRRKFYYQNFIHI